ncbi:MAG: hypothetical protein E7480_04355 [Ruminococcaceae bacterium]|nr:hypothetical protein [Oscillospiraceae bacterium]
MKYKKSTVKVVLLLITCCLIVLCGGIACYMIKQNSKHSTFGGFGAIMVAYIVFFISAFLKIKAQFTQTIELNDKIVFYDSGSELFIQYSEIEKLSYSGTKFVPMSEIMTIHSKDKKIYIDFNFLEYRKIWAEIINECQKRNIDCKIDDKLIMRVCRNA